MKNIFKLNWQVFLALAILITVASCSSEDPEPVNEEELITTVRVTFTNTQDATDVVTATFTDLDGNNDGNNDLDTEMYWQLTNLSDPSAPIYSEKTIERLNEQILREYGISIKVGQTDDAGDIADESNGAIGYSEIYDGSDNWFSNIPDGPTPFNFIQTEPDNDVDPVAAGMDPEQVYSSFGAFTPYTLSVYEDPDPTAGQFWFTPALRVKAVSGVARGQNGLDKLNNVDATVARLKAVLDKVI